MTVYNNSKSRYDHYIPTLMLGASNDFYNYLEDAYFVFKEEDGVTLKAAWERYKTYCDEAKVAFPFSQRAFREELANYFKEHHDRYTLSDGTRVRNYFVGFRTEKFENNKIESYEEPEELSWIRFDGVKSQLDISCKDCLAQEATKDGSPKYKWENVKTPLSKIDTSKLHWVKLPESHIVIDFDIPDENGNKSLEANLKEASKWPKTYCEVSKSGGGVHLHYNYSGDVSTLSRIYGDHIEIKVFTGNSSLRRKLSKFNSEPINTISSGLPTKGEKVINFEAVANEKAIRTIIRKNLNKEYHSATRPSIDFIYKTLEDAYNSGMGYDVEDLYNVVMAFAASSSNQAEYCTDLVDKMHFKSEEPSSEILIEDDGKLIFFDVEVFPNLFILCWKVQGAGQPVNRMINPSSKDIENLIQFKLVGFNNRRYDNHILYGRLIGFTNEQLYELSQNIISNKPNVLFGEAYNLSYTDIYDFASAGNKKGLKKFEIELGIHHKELGLPWDQPVPESKWLDVAEYCDNDVIATEAVFDHLSGDWTARQILADLAGMTVNDTTNTLTTRIVFGKNKTPHDQFNYRDLAKPVRYSADIQNRYGADRKFRVFDNFGNPTYKDYIPGDELPEGYSIMPFFPGYEFKCGKSTFMNEAIGEGGRVYAEPGMYSNVALLDIASQHPTSTEEECCFGVEYTKRYGDLKRARIAIKHNDYDAAREMLDGKLGKFLDSDKYTPKQLSDALKTPINSAYGLTSASFPNAFNDPRNLDNIVAKRGALFMTKLKDEVQRRGYVVAHIKTDSIKIPDADPLIIQFIMDFGKEYGYVFEHEDTYQKMCLVNDAVYIAKKANGKWSPTGTQFAVPYTFKKLFSHEPIEFRDLCETKSVTSAIYLDMNESLPDVTLEEKERDKIWKKLLGDEPLATQDIEEYEKRLAELDAIIATGHNYIFIGKVGSFCPIKEGFNGGLLMRQTVNAKTGKIGYASVTGSKGYRWLEAEMVQMLNLEDSIDINYHNKLVDDAVENISKYGDFEWFIS
jgi:hypothetical protein